jgi:hypothetical protein
MNGKNIDMSKLAICVIFANPPFPELHNQSLQGEAQQSTA